MSSHLGFNCLRSSPSLSPSLSLSLSLSLAGAVRFQAKISCARSPRPIVDLLAASQRSLSISSHEMTGRTRRSSSVTKHILHPQRRSLPACANHQRRTLFGSRSPPVLTNYIHLPADYKDATGLPFRKGDGLDKAETARIFPGTKMTPTRATELLKIMHGRRVAGTLDDPSLRKNTAMFSPKDIKRALQYLRHEVPVDEILNAGLRAEDELRELEAATAGKKGDGGGASAAESEQEKSAPEEKTNASSVYGESILDRIRAANIARAEEAARVEAEQRRREDEAAAQNWGGLTPYDPSLHRGLHPEQAEHYEAATSDLRAPPDTPPWRLLLPTTAFAAAVLAALYLLVAHAAPPRRAAAREAQLAVAAAAALLGAVFVAWKRVRLWRFLNRHFVLDFVAPRPHQLLTALLTHQDAPHLAKNLAVLAAGAALLVPEVGAPAAAATFAAAGVCGALATMHAHVLAAARAARGPHVYMFGASAAALGVVCAYFWLHRFAGFKVLGLPPDPMGGLQGLGVIALLMVYFALGPMARGHGGNVGYLSHLVGMLAGIGCAALMEEQWKRLPKEPGGAPGRKDEPIETVEDVPRGQEDLVPIEAATKVGKE